MTPFAKKVIETDWNMMYGLLEEHFYPRRWMKSDTFPQWLQKYKKIDYFSPAIIFKLVTKESTTYHFLVNDGDNGEMDKEDYENLHSHLTPRDWKKREADLDHF